jgi:3-methyladenine DNA glycosylase Tag
MATKSVIEIDILDDKFKSFQAAFEKYQKAVKGMPTDWQKVNTTLNNIDASQKKMNKSLSDNSKALKDVAFQTGVIAKNLASSAISIAKWVALGAIGSGFGLGGIAASANDYRRKAQGLGISTGDLRGANVTLSRYINPESTLGNIADIKSDLARQQILGRLGGGANQSPAEMLPNLLRNAVSQFKQGGQTQQYAEAMGLTQVFTLEELRRLASLSEKELSDTITDYERIRNRLKVTDADSKAVQDFYVNLKLAGQEIETTLIKAIAPLSGQFSEISKVITEQLTQSITEFANYLSSPEGKQALTDFFEGIKIVADFIFTSFGKVSDVKRGLTIAGNNIFRGGNDTKSAMQYFIDQGLSKNQATGLVANLYAESGLNPNITGDNGKAYGIAQWHPDRQAEFAKVFGHDIRKSTMQEQLDFITYELTHKESAALTQLQKSSTVGEAVKAGLSYERPDPSKYDANFSKRMEIASKIEVKVNNNTGGNAVATANALPGANQ